MIELSAIESISLLDPILSPFNYSAMTPFISASKNSIAFKSMVAAINPLSGRWVSRSSEHVWFMMAAILLTELKDSYRSKMLIYCPFGTGVTIFCTASLLFLKNKGYPSYNLIKLACSCMDDLTKGSLSWCSFKSMVNDVNGIPSMSANCFGSIDGCFAWNMDGWSSRNFSSLSMSIMETLVLAINSRFSNSAFALWGSWYCQLFLICS